MSCTLDYTPLLPVSLHKQFFHCAGRIAEPVVELRVDEAAPLVVEDALGHPEVLGPLGVDRAAEVEEEPRVRVEVEPLLVIFPRLEVPEGAFSSASILFTSPLRALPTVAESVSTAVMLLKLPSRMLNLSSGLTRRCACSAGAVLGVVTPPPPPKKNQSPELPNEELARKVRKNIGVN